MWEVFVEGKQKCVKSKGREELMRAGCRKLNGKVKELVFWILRDEGKNCVGQETMQSWEGLKSW